MVPKTKMETQRQKKNKEPRLDYFFQGFRWGRFKNRFKIFPISGHLRLGYIVKTI